MTVNFVRFQWKATERVKAKILKRVQFPFELDMAGFCTSDFMKKLEPAKDRLKVIADKKAEKKVWKVFLRLETQDGGCRRCQCCSFKNSKTDPD